MGLISHFLLELLGDRHDECGLIYYVRLMTLNYTLSFSRIGTIGRKWGKKTMFPTKYSCSHKIGERVAVVAKKTDLEQVQVYLIM